MLENQCMRYATSTLTLPDSSTSIISCVDGTPLCDLIAAYEAKAGQTAMTGRYAGISASLLSPTGILAHFLGGNGSSLGADEDGRTLILMCECGEAGCWPLTCRIEVGEGDVIWRDFRNPQRPSLDYSGFGPFVFKRTEYEDALRAIA